MDRSTENSRLLIVHIFQDSRFYVGIDMYVGQEVPKHKRPRYITLKVVGKSGLVLDAMLNTGLLDDMLLWTDDGKDSYLLAYDPKVVNMVQGDWTIEGKIFFHEIQASLM